MKRLFAQLMLWLLLPASALAFDLTPYEIETTWGTVAAPVPDGITPDMLEGHPTNLVGTGGGYISFRETEGNPAQFLLYDVNLQLITQGLLPSEYAHLCSLHDDGDAVILSLLLPMKPKTQFLAARIGKDGHLDWQHLSDLEPVGGYSVALPDGAGGAWLSGQIVSSDPYAGTHLTHVSAQGETGSRRILKTGKEILLVQSAISHPESGCVTLYGSLVAKSKGIYTALAITLDPAGNILDTQARDFSMREDTAFSFFIEENGTPWVYSRKAIGYGEKDVLVPFDDLPVIDASPVGLF